MKRIIITGHSGFVGSNLLPYLQNAGYITLGVSRVPKENEISYRELTLNVWDSSIAMVHLAGKANDIKKISNDKEYLEVNYELTKILYDQFLQSDALQFIYISSVKAVADSVDGVLSEAEVPHPITAYGKSKQRAEAYLLDNLPAHKKLYILRPCMIHGPGNKGNLNLLYKLVSKGIGWPLGAFKNTRSFCSIDNLLFIIKELIEREDIPSGIYNVADDEPLSTNELINLIAESQNRKPRIWKLSKGFIIYLTKMGDKLHLPLNSERLQKLTESYVVSNEKIKKTLGKSLPVSSKEGLLSTFQSFNYK
jgi:nucleoside-diphosphate-sugar epimerase